jgi:LysR family transcriptional regulator, cell division regulator
VKVKTRSDLFEVNRAGLKVLVQRLGCSYTERLLTFLETKKVRPERIMEMGTLEGVIGFVEAGVGIAAMPESFIAQISKGRKVVLLPLPKEVATLRTYVVSSQQTASPLVNDFVDHCCQRVFQQSARL